jgi:hypothetical protein
MTLPLRTLTLGLAVVGAALLPISAASAQEAPKPTADGILKLVRLSQANQDLKQLQGRLRDQKSGITSAFTLTMSDGVIRFVFPDPPKETINLDLKEKGTMLTRVNASGKAEMPASLYGEQVRNTAINYEDFSMRFLYWPNAQIMDENVKISFRDNWLIRVKNPDNRGPYGWVDLWIDKGSGAMVKMEAWNRAAKKVKQFKVVKAQKYKDAYILKQMRVFSYDPDTGKEIATTYLEIDDPD